MSIQIDQIVLGLLLACVVSLTGFYLKILTVDGAVGAFFLGSLLFGIGGWKWSYPMLFFFITGSLLSKIGSKRKEDVETEKGSCRDIGQVLANGGLPLGIFVIGFFSNQEFWYYVFLSVCAGVTADTWATEIGTLFKGTVRNIINWYPLKKGLSGGVTWQGSLGALAGALLIAFTSVSNVTMAALIGLCGFLGSVIDSMLGALWQVQYRCTLCGVITEKKRHCNIDVGFYRGVSWMTNDMVNFLCGIFSGLSMIFLLFYMKE